MISEAIHLINLPVNVWRGWRAPRKSVIRFLGAVGLACLAGLTGCRSIPESSGNSEPGREGVWSAYSEEEPAAVPSRLSLKGESRLRYTDVMVDRPYIALTFDDGPNRRLTPELLDILREHDVRATFFVVGRSVAAHPAILRRIADEGHEIGNHTWDHSSLDAIGTDAVRRQLEKTNNVIRAVAGQSPVLMRPPYGKTNPQLNRWIFDQFGLKVILWSVDSSDWQHRDADLVRWEIISGAKPGAIILSHDTQASTIAAMPSTLEALRAEGFIFVTVSELIALEGK